MRQAKRDGVQQAPTDSDARFSHISAMIVASIDPGTSESALVVWDGRTVLRHAILTNEQMMEAIRQPELVPGLLAIEQIKSFGRPVGDEVFSTCVMIGRFYQIATDRGIRVMLVPRMEVKMSICHSPRAKDAHIRIALIDRLGKPGTKKAPGPTYGITSHEWQALALAVTVHDRFNAAPTDLP